MVKVMFGDQAIQHNINYTGVLLIVYQYMLTNEGAFFGISISHLDANRERIYKLKREHKFVTTKMMHASPAKFQQNKAVPS